MVHVQMRDRDMSHAVSRGAGRFQPLENECVELVHAGHTFARLAIADAGIDDNDAVARLHDPQLHRQHQLVHCWNPMLGRHPATVALQLLWGHIGQQELRVVRRAGVFVDASDAHVTDLGGIQHGRFPLRRSKTDAALAA